VGCTVVSTITRDNSGGLIASVLVATDRLSCSSACNRSSPMRLRQHVIDERSNLVPHRSRNADTESRIKFARNPHPHK
jgi:hypothetical protein